MEMKIFIYCHFIIIFDNLIYIFFGTSNALSSIKYYMFILGPVLIGAGLMAIMLSSEICWRYYKVKH